MHRLRRLIASGARRIRITRMRLSGRHRVRHQTNNDATGMSTAGANGTTIVQLNNDADERYVAGPKEDIKINVRDENDVNVDEESEAEAEVSSISI